MATSVLSPEQERTIKETCGARNASLDALEELCAWPLLPAFLKRRFEHLLEIDHRIQIYRFTREAGELRLRTRPTKLYLSKVAAVPARYFDQGPVVVEFRHGWPILSLVGSSANVTEAGAPAKGLGRGFPADQIGETA
jgi:hypothetical protein